MAKVVRQLFECVWHPTLSEWMSRVFRLETFVCTLLHIIMITSMRRIIVEYLEAGITSQIQHRECASHTFAMITCCCARHIDSKTCWRANLCRNATEMEFPAEFGCDECVFSAMRVLRISRSVGMYWETHRAQRN